MSASVVKHLQALAPMLLAAAICCVYLVFALNTTAGTVNAGWSALDRLHWWDGNYYLGIANNGYPASGDTRFFAFGDLGST